MGAILDLPCPSVILSFLHFVIIQMKLEYLWGKLANQLDQILDETSYWRGKDCIRFWDRLDQNSGFHGNRKRPLIYNGENDVSIFLCCFFVRSSTNLLVTRTYQIFNKLAGNQDRHKILKEVEFRLDWISHLGVKRLIMDSPSSVDLSDENILGTLWGQLLLQFSINCFETF